MSEAKGAKGRGKSSGAKGSGNRISAAAKAREPAPPIPNCDLITNFSEVKEHARVRASLPHVRRFDYYDRRGSWRRRA